MTLRLPLAGADLGDPDTWTDVRVCDSQEHAQPVFATVLLHWVTGPVDYCAGCADWMLKVAETLGTECHTEPIELPPQLRQKRAMNLEERL